MYDEAGKKVWEAVLDIYGRVRTLSGDKSSLPFRYQGQYEDVETGLYYNRFRYYDCESGCYISQDPISIAGGLNTYAYVHDTNGWVDVFGLTPTNPIKALDVTTYSDFTKRSAPYDKIGGHELLQHAWLKKNGYVTERLANDASKNNIVIALDNGLHTEVNKAQRAFDLNKQTAHQNIDANAEILKKLGADAAIVDDAAAKAKAHANSLGCK